MRATKKFRSDEAEELRANPYTEMVTAEQISFTLAFKEEFRRLSAEGGTGDMAFGGWAMVQRKMGGYCIGDPADWNPAKRAELRGTVPNPVD